MQVDKYPLLPPSLEELASVLRPALEENYAQASVSVVQCPDLRQTPYFLATEGLTGQECVADVGGQPNLFPHPRLECKYNVLEIAKAMDMSAAGGSLIGAGAGPFHVIGQNSELAPNLSWKDGFDNVNNQTRLIKISKESSNVNVQICASTDCALMVNLFGSLGLPGSVLKVTARGRKGPQKSFSECIRQALFATYGNARPVSLGGTFVVKSGRANCHVMPDFPSRDFKNGKDVNDWLTFHDFDAPIVCLSVLHSTEPGDGVALRMEHTHCFSAAGESTGGHYHGDVEAGVGGQEVAYEAFFNTAKIVYRVDKPEVTLSRDPPH